ncbi:serine hydrolase [Photobacterium sp. TLY01]|uniref:serine hydrolase domain-containing protein n=1 Tax=Photobacterium sp. TLY01 TaxID=2907534 RepID=UPI001F2CD86E|nr:serine hydrolase [Photobacterium sp. TLY01]UIP30439.1 beta-lactamase family protein [Photobacterium sp. TLY01]
MKKLILLTLGAIAVSFYIQNYVDMSDFSWVQASSQQDWPENKPEALGFDEDKLVSLHQFVSRSQRKNVHSLLIAKDGQLVFEQYYSAVNSPTGTPMPTHYPPGPDTSHQMRSVTKTVTATLIGRLLQSGDIPDLKQPLFSYFPQERVADWEHKSDVTLENALMFNVGLDWVEWGVQNSDAMKMWLSPDPYAYILERPMAFAPGERFIYQGGASVLLGGVIERVSGQNLREYAEKALFEPLNITNYEWFAHEVTGQYLGSSGLYLRTRDLAKLGQLYLNQGEWQGQQLLDPQWVKQSFISRGKFWSWKSIEYGYNWWLPDIRVDGQKVTIAGMRGSGGQEMFVVPEYRLIFAMTSGAYFNQDEDYPIQLLADYILPALGLQNVEYVAESR